MSVRHRAYFGQVAAQACDILIIMKHKKRSPMQPLLPNPSDYCTIDKKVKRKYLNPLDAELFAPSREVEQYQCEVCGYWHNGTPLEHAREASRAREDG